MSNIFDSTNVDTADKSFGPNKYISYGEQNLKINKLEIKVASTGSKQVIFHMEGRPITDPAFEGVDGAKGAVGKVSTMYMKPDKEGDLTAIFAKISDALGVRAELNAIKATSLEDYVAKAEKVITGKFANFCIATEQYLNSENKVRNSLRFPKYDYVEAVGKTPSRIKFDKANSYHFKEAVVPDTIGTSQSKTAVAQAEDDLPF